MKSEVKGTATSKRLENTGLEESRVSTLMATECIEVHNKLLWRKKYAVWIEKFAIIWSIVGTEGGKERQCQAPAGISSGNRSGVLYTGVWVRFRVCTY